MNSLYQISLLSPNGIYLSHIVKKRKKERKKSQFDNLGQMLEKKPKLSFLA